MLIQSHHSSSQSPEYALLGFLYRQPCHGYELHQQFVTELGHVWHISQSQTYNILKRLETQGYISTTTLEQEKHPPRQLLHLTAAGRQRFDDWLTTPTASNARAIRVEFITRLYFANALAPQKAPKLLDVQTTEIRANLTRLETILTSVPAAQTFNCLSLELRMRQLRSVLEWLVECRAKLYG